MNKNISTQPFNYVKKHIQIPSGDRAVSITDDEAVTIYNFLVSQNWNGKKTIEIGFAYGYSSSVIVAATGAPHTVIDPFQHQYHNIGIRNMKKLGFWKYTTHIADFSHIALPTLLKKKMKYDFAFIDGAHLFDTIFLDFYYVEKLLSPEGCIIVHDASLPQTKMVLGWIAANRKDFRLQIMEQHNLCAIVRCGEDKRAWQDYHNFRPYIQNSLFDIFQFVRSIGKHI